MFLQLEASSATNAATPLAPGSSVPSPTTVLRHRERASRKLQGLPALSEDRESPSVNSVLDDERHLFVPRGVSRSGRDPFAASGVVQPATPAFDFQPRVSLSDGLGRIFH